MIYWLEDWRRGKINKFLLKIKWLLVNYNLFVTSKNKFSNSPIHEFKVLQNVSKTILLIIRLLTIYDSKKEPFRFRQLYKYTKTFIKLMQRVVFSSAVGRSENPVGQVVMWWAQSAHHLEKVNSSTIICVKMGGGQMPLCPTGPTALCRKPTRECLIALSQLHLLIKGLVNLTT